MKFARVALACILLHCAAFAQRTIAIAIPGTSASIHGDIYGDGPRGLVLAHGGRFNKESWKEQAQVFAHAGFTVLAIAFRGDRTNPDGTPSAEGSEADKAADALAAARYLHTLGLRSVSAIGGSLGGDAVGEADAQAKPGEFDRVVFLASNGGDHPEKLTGRKLYIVARDDTSGDGPRLPGIRAHYARAPQPKKLVIVKGSAHAQFLFATGEGPGVLREILEFISAR